MDGFVDGIKQYAVFCGRARRQAYWGFLLIYLLISIMLAVVDAIIGNYDAATGVGLLSGLFGLVTLLPTLGVTVRRLHDTDSSGWWPSTPFPSRVNNHGTSSSAQELMSPAGPASSRLA